MEEFVQWLAESSNGDEENAMPAMIKGKGKKGAGKGAAKGDGTTRREPLTCNRCKGVGQAERVCLTSGGVGVDDKLFVLQEQGSLGQPLHILWRQEVCLLFPEAGGSGQGRQRYVIS